MPKSNNKRKNGKKKTKRYQRDGKLRIPPVAVAYFFNSRKQLKFIFPITGEHPDVTIKRTIKRSGINPSPMSVKVTPRYFEMVKGLPSSTVELVNRSMVSQNGQSNNAKDDENDVSIFLPGGTLDDETIITEEASEN